MKYELGKKYSLADIKKFAERDGRISFQSDTKIPIKTRGYEGAWLDGLDVEMETEKAAKPNPDINGGKRISESFLDGIDVLDRKLDRNRREEMKHRQEMKKLLGDDYKSPSEKFEDLKRETDWLKGL
ncbi:hypothetical protein LLY41_14345 [Cytobacillus firmus]|uniref:hypothetical protein n=1 Tax=Cytobacillus firmus TaxID=1399 RepID=UPI0021847407|nr:hypothetical protein [Cytobacillus firmus]URM31598.1 hypothetical protein LLY41_14345 [Cytobacillus firmus]